MHLRLKRICATAALSAVMSSAALAHAHLKASMPAGNATVSVPPLLLQLQFSEGIELKFSGVKLTGADKQDVKVGSVSLSAGDASTVEIPIVAPLPAGDYTVEWYALSKDGHKIKGKYTFQFKP